MRRRPFLELRDIVRVRYRFGQIRVDLLSRMLQSVSGGDIEEDETPCKSFRGKNVPFARKYSVLDISSIVSSASASSLANACSSSYSPGRPNRSSRMRPDPAHPVAQKTKMTRAMRIIEPKEEASPMTTPVKAEDGADCDCPILAMISLSNIYSRLPYWLSKKLIAERPERTRRVTARSARREGAREMLASAPGS